MFLNGSESKPSTFWQRRLLMIQFPWVCTMKQVVTKTIVYCGISNDQYKHLKQNTQNAELYNEPQEKQARKFKTLTLDTDELRSQLRSSHTIGASVLSSHGVAGLSSKGSERLLFADGSRKPWGGGSIEISVAPKLFADVWRLCVLI